MKQKNKKWLWIAISAVVLLILLIVMGKSDDEGTRVAVEKTGTHTITETVTASGKIYPETEVKISPEVSGEIIELNVEEGDTVSKGQLLVKINPAIYNSVVQQAEASMQQTKSGVNNSMQMSAQSKASFEQAQSNYNRNKKLFNDKVISATEFEQIEATYKSAKAAYDATQANISSGNYGVKASAANLNQARENLLKTTIVAPRSGIISSLSVKKGERVLGTAQMQGTQVLSIADMSRIELRVDVSETDIAKVKIGDTSIISADAYRNRKFTGVVSKIAVSSTSSSSTSADQVTNYTVHILILPYSYADIVLDGKYKYPFKPGMSASVEIQTRKEYNILSVLVNAVTTRDWADSTQYKDSIRQVVFVYNPTEKKVDLRDVETGIQDNQFIQILAGLKPNEEVVVAPYGAIARLLKDKAKVKTVDKDKLFESKEQ
ncbi:MAG: efflux RND transporter periplasmic adaptor subunit [Phycisphaerales bacterium]|nr:efflux RND transporter periplasmic adaptor subunit [Phycisphaerales bacterium]